MKIQIHSIYGSLLFEGDFSSIAEAVKAALKSRADLSWANLSRADLSRADLSWANLSRADLSWADLSGANLSGADLSGADLSGADLSGADLSRAKIPKKDLAAIYSQRVILPEGDLIGYKKLSGGVIAKLRIPAEAKRVGGLIGRKCRAEYAIVLEGEGFSQHDPSFEYKVGATVRPTEKFDDSVTDECRSGIHFFITRAEAEAY